MKHLFKSSALMAVLIIGLTACESDNDDQNDVTTQTFDTLVLEVLEVDADADPVDVNNRDITAVMSEDEEVFSALF
ncbi:MAG: hypothetical protein MJA28_06825 [Gammaproteobacteria bacterium]|nr:hypothetical protein [Gammaproteobacteria bacterium]